MIYLDSSALFKRYGRESGSDRLQESFRTPAEIATASLSYAEVASALNRKAREGAIISSEYRSAVDELEAGWARIQVIPLSWQVLRRARTLLERCPLRGGDAVQLASALLLADATAVRFASADRRLSSAARSEGFSLLL